MASCIRELYEKAQTIMFDARDAAEKALSQSDDLADQYRRELAEKGIESENLKIRWEHRWGSIIFYLEGVLEIPEYMSNPKAIEVLNEIFRSATKAKDAEDFDFQKRFWKYESYFSEKHHLKLGTECELW